MYTLILFSADKATPLKSFGSLEKDSFDQLSHHCKCSNQKLPYHKDLHPICTSIFRLPPTTKNHLDPLMEQWSKWSTPLSRVWTHSHISRRTFYWYQTEADFFRPGIIFIMEQQLRWMFSEVDKLLTNRRENLLKWCPRSLGPEPEVIWVKMVSRPLIKHHPFPSNNIVVELQTKFNKILDNETRRSRYSTTINPAMRMDIKNYDNLGNLSFTGKCNFWKFIDAEVRILDHDSSSDKRNTSTTNSSISSHHNQHPKQSKSSLHQSWNRPEFTSPTHSKSYHSPNHRSGSMSGGSSTNDIWGEAGCRSKSYFH